MPRSTVSGVSLVSPIAWNVSTSRASSDTVTRFKPAAAKSTANLSRRIPLVVIAKSNSFGNISMKEHTSLLNKGSPPVNLTFVRPNGIRDSTTVVNSS